jgi:hypothetical protein
VGGFVSQYATSHRLAICAKVRGRAPDIREPGRFGFAPVGWARRCFTFWNNMNNGNVIHCLTSEVMVVKIFRFWCLFFRSSVLNDGAGTGLQNQQLV